MKLDNWYDCVGIQPVLCACTSSSSLHICSGGNVADYISCILSRTCGMRSVSYVRIYGMYGDRETQSRVRCTECSKTICRLYELLPATMVATSSSWYYATDHCRTCNSSTCTCRSTDRVSCKHNQAGSNTDRTNSRDTWFVQLLPGSHQLSGSHGQHRSPKKRQIRPQSK